MLDLLLDQQILLKTSLQAQNVLKLIPVNLNRVVPGSVCWTNAWIPPALPLLVFNSHSSPDQDTLTLAFAMLGKSSAAMSFSMAYIVSSEVYPTEVRNWGMGTSSVCARISGMAAPYVGDAMVRTDVDGYPYVPRGPGSLEPTTQLFCSKISRTFSDCPCL